MADDEKCVQVGSFVWKYHESVGWYNADDDDPAWDTEIALLDEIERLRAHIEHLVSTHPLAAEYEAQTTDPSAWMTDKDARRG